MADMYARKLGKGFVKGNEERIVGSIKGVKGGRSKYWNLYFTQERILFIKTLAPKKRKDDAPSSEPDPSLDPEELLRTDAENFQINYNDMQAIDVHGSFGSARLLIQKDNKKQKYSFSKDQYTAVCQLIDRLFPSR